MCVLINRATGYRTQGNVNRQGRETDGWRMKMHERHECKNNKNIKKANVILGGAQNTHRSQNLLEETLLTTFK